MDSQNEEKNLREQQSNYGLVHIIEGAGKGKTSLAYGMLPRALGSGMNVELVRFMKSNDANELRVFESLMDAGFPLSVYTLGDIGYLGEKNRKTHIEHSRDAYDHALASSKDTNLDMLICDEILAAHAYNLFALQDIRNLALRRHPGLELILTGSYAFSEYGNAPEQIIKLASYHSVVQLKQHSYYLGVESRKGIEW